MQAKAEVVIPVFNGLPFVKKSVESCLGQSLDSLRLTVIDNASTDGTWEWLSDLAARDERLSIIRNSSNIGMLANIRKCLAAVKAERFCFLCSDDVLFSPDSMAIASAIMDADNSVGVVYSDMAYIDAVDRVIRRRRAHREGPFSSRDVGFECILHSSNRFGIPLLTKTALLPDIVFDEFLSYTGDVDLAITLGKRGTSWHHPDFLIANRYHGSNATRNLHHLSLVQYFEIARRHEYHLTASHQFQMRFSNIRTMLLKALFLFYAGLRERKRSS